jgi:hypothetical protein
MREIALRNDFSVPGTKKVSQVHDELNSAAKNSAEK